MAIPRPVFRPPFNMPRASHVVLAVKDLKESKRFYVDALGFVVSSEDENRLYLRGLEEGCHHSLVLEQGGKPSAQHIGFRVLTEEDLDAAEAFFRDLGHRPTWVEVPHQARTLRVSDAAGVPLDICASMETRPRLILQSSRFSGACPQRLDHFQILTPHVDRALEFYTRLGFRLSEYITQDGSEEPSFVFLQRKGNPHDIVFAPGPGPGPLLHHAAFTIPETYHLMFICDLLAEMGFGRSVEYGPARHFAPGYARFVYLRDPDGHRIELFNTHYQTIDIEDEPLKWEMAKVLAGGWAPPPPQSWMTEAAPFGAAE
ncbi:VOC family protein [Bradyrhizobium guangxiense]|uniref:VOC family protein n=1 Tax=Bradyrhizobium guangxiense TaxID=1325115 RepID=UPI0010089D18|nr:VOC family protein [Bradyrhizobium guangxiense]